MPQTLVEARPLQVTETQGTGRMQVALITPGWGSSGYYSQQVLEAAAGAKVFPAGTHMFLDHPSVTEQMDRPERSVRDLAAVLTSDAVWDGTGLIAEAQVFGPFRQALSEMAEAIGVSIRATAQVESGEAEGRRGTIVTELVEGISADFVTQAGRGGKVLQLLESARAGDVVDRALAHGVAEATANDTREALQTAVRSTYGDENTWPWLRDFDDTTAWFDISTSDDESTYAQAYELADDGTATLTGSRTEVRARTEYVPVTAGTAPATESVPAPAGRNNTTQESEEDTMPQIEEARLRQLEEDAGRVRTLESERDAAIAGRDEAATERDQLRAREAARPVATRVVGESQSLPPSTRTRVIEAALADLPTGDDGQFDEAAFTTAVQAARTQAETELAEALHAAGVGSVSRFGATTQHDGISEADVDKTVAAAFGRQIKEA